MKVEKVRFGSAYFMRGSERETARLVRFFMNRRKHPHFFYFLPFVPDSIPYIEPYQKNRRSCCCEGLFHAGFRAHNCGAGIFLHEMPKMAKPRLFHTPAYRMVYILHRVAFTHPYTMWNPLINVDRVACSDPYSMRGTEHKTARLVYFP